MDKRAGPSPSIVKLPASAFEAVPRVERGTLVRAYSPIGFFWRGALRHPKALYFGGPELVFSACHFDEKTHAGEYYSEFDDPLIEEVLLQAALSLAIGGDGGVVSLYPFPWSTRIPDELDLKDPKVTEYLGEMILRSKVASPFPLPTDPPPPPSHGGPAYDFRESSMPTKLQKEILNKANPRNHLLVRGLGAWLKARMLMHHQMFTLEALYSLYVALDATFSLIRGKLKEQGVENPDAWDAQAFLEEAEGRPAEGFPYFGDFYVDRVCTMHPESKWGVFPYAPVSNCDAHTLFEELREVFRLLILGKVVDPQNYPAVR
jgi:hypothetical protein